MWDLLGLGVPGRTAAGTADAAVPEAGAVPADAWLGRADAEARVGGAEREPAGPWLRAGEAEGLCAAAVNVVMDSWARYAIRVTYTLWKGPLCPA